jgi:lactoylglutathione lyase
MWLENNLNGVQHLGIPVSDYEKVVNWYAQKLEFEVIHEPRIPTPEGDIKIAFLKKGNIVLEFYRLTGDALEEIRSRGHGHIDHFAIDVLDINQALDYAVSKGISLDASTPEGVVDIPFFWSKGVKYLFLKGPQGEKIELNLRMDLDPTRRAENLNGWSHLGIPVTDINSTRDFYRNFGFLEVMYAEIPVEGESIRASMMEFNGFLLEFYQLLGSDLEEITSRSDGLIDHIALDVKDVNRAFDELREKGLEILEEEPVELPFWEKGVMYFNVRGPDNEKVEFNQIIR